jgi:hypothetical protein
MVSSSREDGMSGEASWYESVVAVVRTHVPATAGVSTGVTVPAETGEENVTEMVVFGATPWAPSTGVVVRSDNPVAPEREDPEPDEPDDLECEPDDVFVDPEWPGAADPFVKNSTAASRTTAPARSTHRRKRNGLPPLDSRTFMASAQDVADSQSDDPSVRARSPRDASGVTKTPRLVRPTPCPTTRCTCTDGAAYDHPDRNANAGGTPPTGRKLPATGRYAHPALSTRPDTPPPHGAPLTLR